MLQAEEDAEDVGIEHRVVCFRGNVGQRSGFAFRAGVVDGDVQPAKSFDRLRDKRAHVVFSPYIGAREFGRGGILPEMRSILARL